MKHTLLVFIGTLALSACEQIFFEDVLSEEDPYVQFDYLWNEVDKRYSFFEVKNIDWDDSYDRHHAMIYDEISDDSLFQVMGSMMSELKDDHTNLFSSTNVSFFGVRYHKVDNYESRIVIDHYIGSDYHSSGPFQHDFINADKVPAGKSIGYIRFGSFTGTVSAVNLNYIMNRYKSTDGLILDLRENGGGAVRDVFKILARFIDEETVVYKSRIRNGKDHDDFSAFEEAVAEPYTGPKYTNKPVVFLVDRGTYSAGSFTSLSTKAIPNVTLMGDSTGGGLGMPNGGQLPNGWNYRFSVTQAVTVDQADRFDAGLEDEINQENFESGVPPDVYVLLDWTDLTRDEILDRAIFEITN
ncbi:S41 family peptidase [Gilvimarinus agarilyticus]|uniref:Tricorn protease C1 domain-containing protein n=1 Tax=Reichenbachiella agariperforans TaxID=156994 RepID=A0A1M6K1I9_REIAG|nr:MULTISPECIES: S41 family peptidase [Reichenbachiella]MBU2887938.1 S41 family peptidase [Gilvimarinus agarilyticus]MBU2913386.1 S41 family peptidase [Reichenbachiella agariperforans]RJE74631.1 hypothetical protein BGP76_15960 [Reichenbachiella sp. MSK19-1]SHJ52819.1 Tricorn protease C1 domain-containing protein [Reichenbachiella agariperforans]